MSTQSPSDNTVVLWINAPDVQALGALGPFGSPIHFFVQSDEWLDFAVYKDSAVDQMFLLVKCTPERAEVIQGALEVIGKQKIRRPIRTRITSGLPVSSWHRRPVNM